MSITYQAKIIRVDPAARVMELEFSSEGRPSYFIGARLPFEGESLEAVVRQYAPVPMWVAAEAQVVIPEAGTELTIAPEAPAPLTVDDQRRAIVGMIQARLDGFASNRGYDSILSACSYATSTNPTFRAEGERAVALRDATWLAAQAIEAEVLNGTRPMPSSIQDIIDDLPALFWPDQTGEIAAIPSTEV